MSRALAWLSSSIPAQASATTCTSTPSSAAASAVDRTQQSVETPASTIRPPPRIAVQLVAHLAEGRGVHRRERLTGELVHELVDPRIRRLQRERPELVVAAPRPGRDGRSHEPGEDDVRPVGGDEPLDGAHDLGEPGREPGAVALAEHPLHVDDHERRLPLRRRACRAGHHWAAAGSSGGAPSWARTADRPYTHCATNPSTRATSTPRLANAQAPVFPPRPNGPSR